MMSLTPEQHRKVGTGVAQPSPAPFFTPRLERRKLDSRLSDWNSNRLDKDKESNVQVLLRCRPLTEEEQRLNVPKAVTCNESKREVNVPQNVGNKQVDRVFTFDKVFGPKAQQRSIYDQAISPIVNDVLEGFNCTVFAYGQTGTGKTYTMEGGMKKKGVELSAEAGVIPRAVRQIFDTLEAQNADFNMKVTFLELYNEEITDLLAQEDGKPSEERLKKSISLMEDGKGCVFVRGLEEESVYSANDIHVLLERGSSKRRTADTLLNKHSSRSHSVFSITVHVKESTVGEEELIKCGKLNLVDLAGSENISRSGAREGRAREAGEINKSLLTLGRVINALVEHSVHVPYRDSKLTRILRDSLGGKTKTCIIATISPSAHFLEETLSTLDYAHRAKTIKNKPEANQKVSKTVLLKDLYLEMERMKQDIRAAREKNGVYISHERFLQDEAERKAKNEKIDQMQSDLSIREKQVEKFRELYRTEREEKFNVQNELKDCKENLETQKNALQDLKEKYNLALSRLKEKEFFISKLQHSENCLVECAKDLQSNLTSASSDLSVLFAKIEKKNRLEADNQDLLLTFGSQIDQSLKDLHKTVLGSLSQQQHQLRCMQEHVSIFFASKFDTTQLIDSKLKNMENSHILANEALTTLADALQMKASSDMEQMKYIISSQANTVENFLKSTSLEAKEIISHLQSSLDEQRQLVDFSVQQQQESLHKSLGSAEVIANATVHFFTDIYQNTSMLMEVIEESNKNKFHQLQSFEAKFKEEALKDEESAIDKIAEVLASLTAKRTAMVSDASREIKDSTLEGKKRLLQGLSLVQLVTVVGKKEVFVHAEKVKNDYLEDTFASAERIATMEDCLLDCVNKVDSLNQQQQIAESGFHNILNRSLAETESAVQKRTAENQTTRDELMCQSSSVAAEVHSQNQNLLELVNDSLMQDNEFEKQIQSVSNICLDQLNTLRKSHGESVSDVRNKTEQCLRKDYLVDESTDDIPEKRTVPIPSTTYIEEMRTVLSDVNSEPRSNCINSVHKVQPQLQPPCVEFSPNRTPFGEVN